jgi:hypothetical protein
MGTAGRGTSAQPGCSILAERIAINTGSGHIIGADAGDRAFHAAIFCNDRAAIPDISAKDLRRLRRYIIQRKGKLPIRNPIRPGGERLAVVGFFRQLLVNLGVPRWGVGH